MKLLQKRLNIAMLFVTHDQIEALSLSNRIALMNFGVVQQQGDPRLLYEEPVNEFVRDFVGRTLLFKGKVQTSNPSGQMAIALAGARDCVVFGRCYNPGGMKAGESVYIGVRPEDVDIQPALGAEAPAGMIGGTTHADKKGGVCCAADHTCRRLGAERGLNVDIFGTDADIDRFTGFHTAGIVAASEHDAVRAPARAMAIWPDGLLVCTLPLKSSVLPTKSRTNSLAGSS